MSKKIPQLSEPAPVSLIDLDPAAAARSIAAVVAMANDEKDWLDEKVRIQFYNIEEPGQPGFFMYGSCLSPTKIELQHGEIATLTRAEVRYIESRQRPIYSYRALGNGKQVKTRTGWQPRFQCRQVHAKAV